MEEKPNYFAVIPADVRYDSNLSSSAKLLYGEITALSQRDGKCWARNSYFAELYKVSLSTVSLWIKQLVDNKHLTSTIVYKEGTREILNRYLEISKEGYLEKLENPPLKNLKENNTSINNTSNNNIVPDELKTEFKEYVQMRKLMKKPLTESAIKRALNRLNKLSNNVEIQKKILNQSVDHCWLDLYPLKDFKQEDTSGSQNYVVSDDEFEELKKLAGIE